MRALDEAPADPCRGETARCASPYEALARSVAPQARCPDLDDQLAQARREDRAEGGTPPWHEGRGWSAERLARALGQRLDTDSLGRADDLAVFRAPPELRGDFQRSQLAVLDPRLGVSRLALWTPAGDGPHAAVLGLPGHGQTEQAFLRDHAGRELLTAGFAVAVSLPRAFDDGPAEDRATRALLCAGSSMMAARVEEARAALAILRSQPDICPNRLGALSHSGGSLVLNVLAWIEPTLRAALTDMEGRYNGARERPDGPPLLRDETHLGLRSLNLRLIEFADSPVPTKRVRYGMPDGAAEVVAWFERALLGPERVASAPPLPPPQ